MQSVKWITSLKSGAAPGTGTWQMVAQAVFEVVNQSWEWIGTRNFDLAMVSEAVCEVVNQSEE